MDKLKFSVISDSHITHFHDGEAMFTKMAEFHKNKLPKMDMAVFLGDIIYQLDTPIKGVCENLYEGQYDYVNNCLETYFYDTKNVMLLGNHEFAQANTSLDNEALKIWERKFGQPHTEHFVEKGYHFIKAPVLSYDCTAPAKVEKELISMLKNALADGDKPVFLLSHCAAPNTEYYTYGSNKLFSQEFRDFLGEQPRIIHITGHEHYHVLDEQAIHQDNFTTISAPMVSVGAFGFTVKDNEPIFSISQFLWFEVEGRRVTVHKIDVTGGREVGTPWIIDIDETEKGIFRYDDSRFGSGQAPEFADDARLLCKKGADICFEVEQSFKTEETAYYYYLVIKDRLGLPIFSQRYTSDFYYLSVIGKHAAFMPIRVKGLRPGKYTAEVYPLSNLLTQGEKPLMCEFKV